MVTTLTLQNQMAKVFASYAMGLKPESRQGMVYLKDVVVMVYRLTSVIIGIHKHRRFTGDALKL